MKKYFNQAKHYAFSSTAKDTYTLFAGNILSAFLGFLYTLIVARSLTVSDFGIFSAINNLIVIIASVTDIGISAGLMKFVSNYFAKGQTDKSDKYIKASLNIKLSATFLISIVIFSFSSFIAKNLLATDDRAAAYWTIILSFALLIWGFFPLILQAYKKFIKAIIVENTLGLARVISVFAFVFVGSLSISKALAAFAIGAVATVFVALYFIGTSFLKVKVTKKEYYKLFKFSGWVGVNRIISSVSGRLDIQMLAALAGATVTGLYSISSRLAFFVIVLASSFSNVLTPRLSSFEDKGKEKAYILKSALALIPMVVGIIVWIIVAKPFILLLFGDKYIEAVPVFRALAASMIPFIISAPSVTAIIYAIKKPIYIGTFSFFQIISIFSINLMLIPKIGSFAPTVSLGLVHTVLAIYTWGIVIKYYWIDK